MARAQSPWAAVAWVALAMLATAGVIGLLEPTETRYAEIAREMLAGRDFLVPRLDGILHFHKPPLAYWAAAAGFAVLGVDAWGGRIPAVLASAGTLAFTAVAARRRFAPLAAPPALAVWLLGTSLLFFGLGRAVDADPWLALSVAAFWALAPSPWALAAVGVGFLAKGPVVLVHTVAPVLVTAAWGRDRSTLALLGPSRGWWLAAAIGLPWYLWIVARVPGLFSYLLGHQLWERYTTTVHGRPGPPWYLVAVLVAGMLPWTAAMVGGIRAAWRARARTDARLLLAWLLVPLVFLSFSGSKLPGYLLPVLPAAALFAALRLAAAGRTARVAIALSHAALAVGAGVALLGVLPHSVEPRRVDWPIAAWAVVALLIAGGGLAWRRRWVASAAATLAALVALFLAAAPHERTLGAPRSIVTALRAERRPGEPVVEVDRFSAGLPLHLGERVLLYRVPRETQFESRVGGASRVTLDRAGLADLAARHRRVWVLGPEASCKTLADSLGLEYRPFERWGRSRLGVLSH